MSYKTNSPVFSIPSYLFILENKNMEVTPQALEEFKKIYKEKFKEDISDDEALEMAQRVLAFFSLIYRPLPDQEEPNQAQ